MYRVEVVQFDIDKGKVDVQFVFLPYDSKSIYWWIPREEDKWVQFVLTLTLSCIK